MKVLLTGGAGFIGSHLTESLLEDDHKVTIVDNYCSSQESNIEHLREKEDLDIKEKDVLDKLEFERNFDYILHFASIASTENYQNHPIHTLRTNSEGTLKMLKLADKHNSKCM